MIKPINAHNQKMGLNFDKPSKDYVPIQNPLFNVGVYKDLATRYK
jgi:hypothetical protein